MTEPALAVDGMFALAVLGMTVVTYGLRAGGYWVMGRVPLTMRVRRALEALPGAIVVSTITPIALQGGVPVVLCLCVAAGAMLLFRKDAAAVGCAVIAVALLRAYGA